MITARRGMVLFLALGFGLGLLVAGSSPVAGAREGGVPAVPGAPSSTPAPPSAVTIGFVDIEDMFRRHKPFQEEAARIREEARANERKLRDKAQEITALEGRMFLAPRHGYLQRKLRADEERLRGELDFIKNWNATEAEQKQLRLRARYYEKFRAAVSRYGEQHGYTALFKRTAPPRIRSAASLAELNAGIRAHTALFVDRRAADLTAAVLATLRN